MSANYMLLKSCKVSKKAKAVTSSTLVTEKANSVIQSCFKGHLCCKTITSPNVSSEAQVKHFLFRRKLVLYSQDSQVFVFLNIL